MGDMKYWYCIHMPERDSIEKIAHGKYAITTSQTAVVCLDCMITGRHRDIKLTNPSKTQTRTILLIKNKAGGSDTVKTTSTITDVKD